MELSDYIRVLRRSWVLLVVAALVGGGGAAAYALRETPMYTSESTVVVTLNSAGTINDFTAGQSYIASVVTTYASIATKPVVLAPVIKTLGLKQDPSELASEITITASNTSQLIGISVEDASPTSRRPAAALRP